MTLNDFTLQYKPRLQDDIEKIFDERISREEMPDTFQAYARLKTFSTKGKLLRGLFVILAEHMYGGETSENTLKAAAAMEVTQAALLTHDDIMDNDLMRRGYKTIFAQYIDDAVTAQSITPYDYGVSMGMVVGDIGMMLSQELLGSMQIDGAVHIAIMREYSSQLQKTFYGQMFDYEYGSTSTEPTEAEIMQMYDLKTGSYTFQLPFTIGALLGGATEAQLEKLKETTHPLGTIFQIKDDELGIFGKSEQTGKPVGSDIVENKKTLIRAKLLEKLPEDNPIREYFGNRSLTAEQIEEVCVAIRENGVLEEIDVLVQKLSNSVRASIKNLDISQEYKDILSELVDFNAERAQ